MSRPERDGKKEKEQTEGIYLGQEQEVELVDWEEIFKNHIAETRILEKERIEKKERSGIKREQLGAPEGMHKIFQRK